MKEMVGGCCVCSDDRGWSENPLVYCDGQSCTVAVHQACYGIVTVPTGPWYCRKCESQERTARVKCELCPSKYGALKRTDNSGWAHVVCALYIPEVRFGNVTTMEPILLQLIPAERFNKACYICEEQGKASNAAVGACMQCNKTGCKQQFHVTCAQALGLLCEEAGNYLDNVKYCGYCQHHYSKLRKGGNVKPIPPYKPISTENHLSDSNSDKDVEAGRPAATASVLQQPSVGKRSKSSASTSRSANATSRSTTNTKTSSANSAHQKTVHASAGSASAKGDKDNKVKISNSTVRISRGSDEIGLSGSVTLSGGGSLNSTNELLVDNKTDKVSVTVVKEVKGETSEVDTSKVIEIKESKGSRKKKTNSRTPTPNTILADTVIPAANLSVLIPELSASVLSGITGGSTVISVEKRELKPLIETSDKIKKIKLEQAIPIPAAVTTTSVSLGQSFKTASPPQPLDQPSNTVIESGVAASAIQSPNASSVNSLVVSVPLSNTNLSQQPHNQSNVLTAATPPSLIQDRISAEDITGTPSVISSMTGGTSGTSQSTGIITTEMSGGGLKVLYDKQQPASTLRTELERTNVSEQPNIPTKRSRSMSGEKSEKGARGKKRTTNASVGQFTANKRISRSQHSSSPTIANISTSQPKDSPSSSSIIPPNEIKESPPSSPSSENHSLVNTRGNKGKGRRSAPATATSTSSSSTKDNKDNLKVFQNGVTAPHMLGNQLNPNSNMAQKMSDHLSSELEAHSIFTTSEQPHLIGPQLHHRVLQNARANSTGGCSTGGSSTTSGGSGFSMLGGGGGSIPQTLDQLLERQWEQGSQFLMEQAQHFDIASLLSCLHQLRAENLRLEEHVSSLLQRRDHLLAVNARLAIPLTNQPSASQATSHSHTVNNIHPSVVTGHSSEIPRSRHSGGSGNFSSHSQVPVQHAQQSSVSMPVENGLPPEQSAVYPHQHRSPASNHPSQSSSNLRHSPAGSTGYPSSGLARSGGDNGRTAPRPQPYGMYPGPGPSNAQTQVVIRRESEAHHQQQQQQQQQPPSSKSS